MTFSDTSFNVRRSDVDGLRDDAQLTTIDRHVPLTSLSDYQELCDSFCLNVPEFFNFGFDVVDQWAKTDPDLMAMRWVNISGEDRKITFAEMSYRSNQVANALFKLGLKPGDQVLVLLPSRAEWWEVMIGITKAGMIAIPATKQLTEKDISFRIESAEIDAVITDDSSSRKVDHAARGSQHLLYKILIGKNEPTTGWESYHELVDNSSTGSNFEKTKSDQPALIYFTSGTTGPPKMVLHTHASYGIGHQITARFWLGLDKGRLHWNLSDPGWAKTAFSGYFAPWIAGSTVFICDHPGKFDAQTVLDCLTNYPIESLCAPPTVYRMLIQKDLSTFNPSALRYCMAAGEPLNINVLNEWREQTGMTIREGYGQTETVILCASIPDLEVKPGSMGLPPPGLEVAIIDQDGNRLPPGEQGEIAVRVKPKRPIGLFHGYWQNPDATARCYRGDWYLTGDCAYADDDGYLWFVARADDIITSSGYRIGPFEVENALMQHPAVAEVAVVGKPDSQRTEIVKAFVVLAEGFQSSDALANELQEHTKKTTAPYKYPREVEFLDQLPKTPSDKIRRVELRKRG